jgi:hypothetical protein
MVKLMRSAASVEKSVQQFAVERPLFFVRVGLAVSAGIDSA